MTNSNPQIPIIADALEKEVTRKYDRFFEEMDELIRNRVNYAEFEDDGEVDDLVDDVITMLYHRLGVYNALKGEKTDD